MTAATNPAEAGGPVALTERSRAAVRGCWCGHEIVPQFSSSGLPLTVAGAVAWVHVETGRSDHAGIRARTDPIADYAYPANRAEIEARAQWAALAAGLAARR